jgi:signal transduction histidine kinase/CheY-like chemotaxis protein
LGVSTSFVQLLRDHRDHIVSTFVEEVVKRGLAPDRTARVLLVDRIPEFLDDLANELGKPHADANVSVATDTSETARHHGEQRWAIGYDFNALIREYGVLRECIVRVAHESQVPVSMSDVEVLAKCINIGIAEAATEYIKFRDEEVNEHRARVDAAARAKDELVAVVSHELRTPLNSILGWLRLMRSHVLDEAKFQRALDIVERNAEAQNRLVDDLLDISRVVMGKLRLNLSEFDFGTVVELAVEGIRPAAEAKRISIETTIADDDSFHLRGDQDRLQQVTWNLLVNGIKFTPKNGSVRVSLQRIKSEIELVVSDTGEGIDAAFLPYIFESFRQSDSSFSRPHGGLGIGLSIAKHIVDLHGGRLEITSAGKGKGTTARLRLPISPLVTSLTGVPPGGVIGAAGRRIPPGKPLPLAPSGIRALVVDDEADARELVACALEMSGIEVRSASNVPDALNELATFTPSVIISDLGLPDAEDGHLFVRSVRAHADEEKRKVPIIALTGLTRPQDKVRAINEGFNLYITKPVEPFALVQAVLDLVGVVAAN